MIISQYLIISAVTIPLSIVGLFTIAMRSKRMRNFVQLDAKIEKLGKKEVHTEGLGPEYNIDILYSYSYRGNDYTNSMVNILEVANSSLWRDHQPLYENLLKSQSEKKLIKIWVDPNEPNTASILKRKYDRSFWLFIFFGFIGVASLIYGL